MRFDLPVAPGGYAWWYVDAVSDDGAHALTLIAFIGSVFSPYYAWANAKAPADAENFCAMNVALYGRRKAWAMTERGRGALRRGADFIEIGPSGLRWDGALSARISEITVPIPGRLRGRFTLRPQALQKRVFTLDAAGRHRWRPIAPAARIEVEFSHPRISWSGLAYFDSNEGDAPLAADFESWHWSRGVGAPHVMYDVARRDGTRLGLALAVGADGTATAFEAPPVVRLPRTMWGVERLTRGEGAPRILQTLEDAPFYARSRIATRVDGVDAEAIHESLDLRRFSAGWVRMLRPFRMPRVG
jgi:carotenoid 1,2-hydratase